MKTTYYFFFFATANGNLMLIFGTIIVMIALKTILLESNFIIALVTIKTKISQGSIISSME